MEILHYLLKVNLSIAVFYVVYRIGYRNDTYFQLRRYLLLSMLIISVACPLLDISYWVNRNPSLNETAVAYIQYLPEVIASAYLPEVIVTSPEVTINSFPLDYFLVGIYAVLAGLLLLRFALRLYKIIGFRLRCTPIEISNQKAYLMSNQSNPFSFFNWIFINPTLYKPVEIHEIMTHELVHVQQYHSIDILLSELACTFFWFNPFVWMLKNEVFRNLEFLVDNKVIRNGIDSRSYQLHLLRLANNQSPFLMANQFKKSPLKERIIMLNKKQTSKNKLIAYTLLLPLAFIFLVANNVGVIAENIPVSHEIKSVIDKAAEMIMPDETVQPLTQPSVAVTNQAPVQQDKFMLSGRIVNENKIGLQGVNIVIQGTTAGTITDKDGQFSLTVSSGDKLVCSYVGFKTFLITANNRQTNVGTIMLSKEVKSLEELVVVGYGAKPSSSQTADTEEISANLVFIAVEDMPSFPGGEAELMRFLGSNIKYPVIAQENGIQGSVECSFIIGPDGAITDIVAKGIDPSLEREAMRIVGLMPRWNPGKQRGVPVPVEYSLPITFRLQQ